MGTMPTAPLDLNVLWGLHAQPVSGVDEAVALTATVDGLAFLLC